MTYSYAEHTTTRRSVVTVRGPLDRPAARLRRCANERQARRGLPTTPVGVLERAYPAQGIREVILTYPLGA